MEGSDIKSRLHRTWMPFFAHFGRFTPIQELTIPVILGGHNVVVISPAATGKTEAVIAPIIENLFGEGSLREVGDGLKVLYISPTRALVNDLCRRLSEPVDYMNMTISVKTGDRPHLTAKKVPDILLTTPESFDSLLTRRPRLFLDLHAVILDEIHLLDNTPRGDQLRILLNRLRKINSRLQYCALSATIDDLDIGSRYFPDAKVCLLKAPREIEYQLIDAKNFVNSLMGIARQKHIKKILVFFNARSLAELYSQKLNIPPFMDRVFVHHASLPRARREEVEHVMNSSEQVILCATSTLELGIDIGSVDCVVLFRPPFNVSSLLQRIGRGNRRTQALFAIGVHTSGWEKLLFNTYFDCARQGILYDKRYNPALSVIPQQIYSYCFQRRRVGTTFKSVVDTLSPVYDVETIRDIFKHLYENGKIQEARPGIYFDSPALEKKIDWGKIHSNIAETSFGEYDVYNVTVGNLVGRVFHLRERFVLGGRCWQISRIDEKEKKVYAKCVGDASAVTKIFEGKGAGSYNYLLAPTLKASILPELLYEEFPYAIEGSNTHILHLLGSLYGFILAEALFHENIDAMDVEGKLLVLNKFMISDDRFPIPGVNAIRKVIADNIRRLEDALGSGAYFYDLPVEHQVEDHCLDLDISGFREFLQSLRLVNVEVERFRQLAESVK